MTASTTISHRSDDLNEKGNVTWTENAAADNPSAWEIQQRFETLKNLSETEMRALNNHVKKTIDWRMMPCVTVMFLMKLVNALGRGLRPVQGPSVYISDAATWTASTSRTPASLVCRRIAT